VHQNPDPSPTLFHPHLLRRDLEPLLPHQLEKGGRLPALRVGEESLATGCEQPGGEIRECRSVHSLVEHVGGESEVEGPEVLRLRRVPVEERGSRRPTQVRPGVVDREVQGCFVVIGSEDLRAAREGCDGRESDAAAELDGTPAGQILAREVSRQGDRARPELGPVREPLVALEISIVYEGVGGGGVQDAVTFISDLYDGLGEPCAAAEMCLELFRGIFYRPTEAAARAARLSRSAAASWAML
jgi:hypothetical protein